MDPLIWVNTQEGHVCLSPLFFLLNYHFVLKTCFVFINYFEGLGSNLVKM